MVEAPTAAPRRGLLAEIDAGSVKCGLEGVQPGRVVCRGRRLVRVAAVLLHRLRKPVAELAPGYVRPLERDDGHAEDPSLPRLVEHELSVRARERSCGGERAVEVGELGLDLGHAAVCLSGSSALAVPIIESRVTSSA